MAKGFICIILNVEYKIGLIIGRFQPFHRGHLYLIKKALNHIESLIIAVGSANIYDEKNPFSFEDRKKFIMFSLKKHLLLNRIKKIIPIDDYLDDDDYWLEQLKKKTGPFEVSFGNNNWVNGILEKRGLKVIKFPLYKRHKYEGVKIREEIKHSKNPEELLKKNLP